MQKRKTIMGTNGKIEHVSFSADAHDDTYPKKDGMHICVEINECGICDEVTRRFLRLNENELAQLHDLLDMYCVFLAQKAKRKTEPPPGLRGGEGE